MKAYIYKDNELEKIQHLNSHNVLTKKGKDRLKFILNNLQKLQENNRGNYYVEIKISKR